MTASKSELPQASGVIPCWNEERVAGLLSIDTVFGDCHRRGVFDRIGLFDEKLTRAPDREFKQRLPAAGGGILPQSDITCTYYFRIDSREFAPWTFEGGYWPFGSSRSVGHCLVSWRNVVPMSFAVAVGGILDPGRPA